MGSSALPMVGMGGYGNPAGVAVPGMNPNFEQETFKKLQNFAPASKPSAVPFGGTGATPFAGGGPQLSPALPTITPAPTAPTSPVAAAPGTGSGQGGNSNLFGNGGAGINGENLGLPTVNGTQFGYNTPQGGTGAGAMGSLNPADMSGGNWKSIDRALGTAYGRNGELGRALGQILKNGAGWNPQIAETMMHDIEPYFQENMGNILEAFGQSGQRYSSTAALATGKFAADFTSHQQALYAQMYQWAVNNYIGIMTGGKFAGGPVGNPNAGLIAGGLSMGASAASAGLAASAAGSGTMASILAGLAAI